MPQKGKFCDHCKEYVAISTYKRHKLDYYDDVTKQRTVVSNKRQDKGRLFEDQEDHTIISSNLNSFNINYFINLALVHITRPTFSQRMNTI